MTTAAGWEYCKACGHRTKFPQRVETDSTLYGERVRADIPAGADVCKPCFKKLVPAEQLHLFVPAAGSGGRRGK